MSDTATDYELPTSKEAALGYIMEAWYEAKQDGIEPEAIANAALFAALSDLITIYGEIPVVEFTEGLADRVRRGEFTLHKTTQ